jgi:ornithine carbamoyltransferase
MERSQPPTDVLSDMQKYKEGFEEHATCKKCDYAGAMAIISNVVATYLKAGQQ